MYVRLQVVVNISSIELKTKVILNDDSQQLYNTKTSTSTFEKKFKIQVQNTQHDATELLHKRWFRKKCDENFEITML